eukprot:TRINITY_DN651_c0_g1_i3.p1 TRINITY_DN651_c0_g1~~TRINITY_DN651_c0_g1_i3.p1  ORF type:complete len:103 (-),score=21.11 TRINITY_DN651_c0_g1_i3:262-570(-)
MYILNGKDTIEFQHEVLYHSYKQQKGSFLHLQVIMNSFRVLHYHEANWYNGWMSKGNTGGFAFYLLILHYIAMAGVGAIFRNDSCFLLGKDPEYTYIPDDEQ